MASPQCDNCGADRYGDPHDGGLAPSDAKKLQEYYADHPDDGCLLCSESCICVCGNNLPDCLCCICGGPNQWDVCDCAEPAPATEIMTGLKETLKFAHKKHKANARCPKDLRTDPVLPASLLRRNLYVFRGKRKRTYTGYAPPGLSKGMAKSMMKKSKKSRGR